MTTNPFKSQAQRAWMYENDPEMARRWEKHTLKKRLPAKVTRNRRNPLRIDPTRTVTLRRAFIAKLRRAFRILKGRIVKLIAEENALALNEKPLFEVPDVRQHDHYSCGAAAAMCVGQYFGVGPDSLSDWKRALGTDVEESTRPGAIVEYMSSLGLGVTARDGMSIEDLAGASGPVICPVQDYGPEVPDGARFAYGHYLTVIGVRMGYVFCQDSSEDNVIADSGSAQQPGRIMISTADWDAMWHDEDIDGNKYVRYGIEVSATRNAFCATGPGGGVDPSCGRSAMLSKVPGVREAKAAMSFMKGVTSKLYTKLETRYGRTAAIAIMVSGQAIGWGALGVGAVIGVPLYLPGSSAWGAIPGAAIAETILQASRGIKHLTGNLDIAALGREFAAEVHREFLRYLAAVENKRWAFETDPKKVEQFQAWLKAQYKDLGLTDEQLWAKYIADGFRKGAGRSFDDTKDKHPDDNRDQFLRSAFARPVAQEKVELLAGRAFDDMEGVTSSMATRMSRELTDGMVEGKSPRDVARDIAGETDIGLARAETIARTELIRAHAEGQLDALEQLGVEEIGVQVEWSTADDAVVCELCDDMDGVVLSLDDARNLIPRHPNCRCAFIPANVDESTLGQKRGAEADAAVDRIENARLNLWLARTSAAIDRRCELAAFNRSFFADCKRNAKGRCLPAEGGGTRASEKEMRAAQRLAVAKAIMAPKPTAEEVAHAVKMTDLLGANTYRRNLVGNSKDRAKSRKALLEEFGDGEKCPCVYCGLHLDDSTVTRDKIVTTRQGGKYRNNNLVPACMACNQSRGDTPFKEIKWLKG